MTQARAGVRISPGAGRRRENDPQGRSSGGRPADAALFVGRGLGLANCAGRRLGFSGLRGLFTGALSLSLAQDPARVVTPDTLAWIRGDDHRLGVDLFLGRLDSGGCTVGCCCGCISVSGGLRLCRRLGSSGRGRGSKRVARCRFTADQLDVIRKFNGLAVVCCA